MHLEWHTLGWADRRQLQVPRPTCPVPARTSALRDSRTRYGPRSIKDDPDRVSGKGAAHVQGAAERDCKDLVRHMFVHGYEGGKRKQDELDHSDPEHGQIVG